MQTSLTNETLTNVHTGDQLTILRNTSEAPGSVLHLEAIYKPAKAFAPEHFHPLQEERFEVISGKLMTQIKGVVREYQAGEIFIIPKSVPHAMYNASDADTHFSWQIKPALQTENFFRRTYQLINTAKLNKKGLPPALDMLAVLKDFQQEFVLTKIPLPMQKALYNYILPFLRKK